MSNSRLAHEDKAAHQRKPLLMPRVFFSSGFSSQARITPSVPPVSRMRPSMPLKAMNSTAVTSPFDPSPKCCTKHVAFPVLTSLRLARGGLIGAVACHSGSQFLEGAKINRTAILWSTRRSCRCHCSDAYGLLIRWHLTMTELGAKTVFDPVTMCSPEGQMAIAIGKVGSSCIPSRPLRHRRSSKSQSLTSPSAGSVSVDRRPLEPTLLSFRLT